ncbi:hypothetical protein FGO68_gene7892 [Halteria grandinella]|uniref:Uncharacterized protein n=1 Tax=Halteria grandinella TaxID=5974 RepID=A0A8J8T4A5_HALGN|nr:hypothetical protein FGO68_gene7892 [Halteria grandinella]
MNENDDFQINNPLTEPCLTLSNLTSGTSTHNQIFSQTQSHQLTLNEFAATGFLPREIRQFQQTTQHSANTKDVLFEFSYLHNCRELFAGLVNQPQDQEEKTKMDWTLQNLENLLPKECAESTNENSLVELLENTKDPLGKDEKIELIRVEAQNFQATEERRPKVNTELIYKSLLRQCRLRLKEYVDQIILNRTPSIDQLNKALSEKLKKVIGKANYQTIKSCDQDLAILGKLYHKNNKGLGPFLKSHKHTIKQLVWLDVVFKKANSSSVQEFISFPICKALFIEYLKEDLLNNILIIDRRGYNESNSKKGTAKKAGSKIDPLAGKTWPLKNIMSFHHELTEVLGMPELWPTELNFIKELNYVQISPGKASKSGVPKAKTQLNQRSHTISKKTKAKTQSKTKKKSPAKKPAAARAASKRHSSKK